MTTHTLMVHAYTAFNRRDVEGVLALMTDEVSWPKVSEGGRAHGKQEIREYWTRQWAEFDPQVTVLEVKDGPAGRTEVRVHQVVRSLDGTLLADAEVRHLHTIVNGLIARMDLQDGDDVPSAAFSK